MSSTHGQGATAVPVEPPPPPPTHSLQAPSLAESIFKGLLFLGGAYLAAKATEAVFDSLTSPSEAARQPRRLPEPEPEWEEELLDWKHAERRAEAQVAESYPRALVARQVRVGSRLEGVRVADLVAYHPNHRATSVEVKHVRELRSRHIEQARDAADKHAADHGMPTGALLLAPPEAVSARNLATARRHGVKIEPLR